MFTPVGNLLNKLPRRSRLSGAMAAVFVFKAWNDALAQEAPGVVKQGVKAKMFKNGTLTVVCPPIVGSELSMRARGLIRTINERLGKRAVLKLRFVKD